MGHWTKKKDHKLLVFTRQVDFEVAMCVILFNSFKKVGMLLFLLEKVGSWRRVAWFSIFLGLVARTSIAMCGILLIVKLSSDVSGWEILMVRPIAKPRIPSQQ